MQNLANAAAGVDVFVRTTESEIELVKEYNTRNQRKLADEKWLKANKPNIEAILSDNDRDRMDFDGVRASISIPDTSKFDDDKLVRYFLDNDPDSKVLKEKFVIDEVELASAIELGCP
jgi:hypothetical protein